MVWLESLRGEEEGKESVETVLLRVACGESEEAVLAAVEMCPECTTARPGHGLYCTARLGHGTGEKGNSLIT